MTDPWARYRFVVRHVETGVVCFRCNDKARADETASYLNAADGGHGQYIVEERIHPVKPT